MLYGSLCEASAGDHLCASLLAQYDATAQSVQELQLLLGLHCLRVLSRQSSFVHLAVHVHRLGCSGRLCCESQTIINLNYLLLISISLQLCELGNFSVHIALRNLRPPGTKVRRIPVADSNPFTKLFKWVCSLFPWGDSLINCLSHFSLVSCPNYTYEIGAWVAFSAMTSCLPAYLFAFAGAFQMTVWALGKHRNYRKEFKDYPKGRRAIFPFVL